MPTIVWKSITTTWVKKELLEICGGDEKNFGKLVEMRWSWVLGNTEFTGGLSFDQQIRYVELALERLSNDFLSDEQGCAMKGAGEWYVRQYLEKRDKTMFEKEIRELIICDEEAMIRNKKETGHGRGVAASVLNIEH